MYESIFYSPVVEQVSNLLVKKSRLKRYFGASDPQAASTLGQVSLESDLIQFMVPDEQVRNLLHGRGDLPVEFWRIQLRNDARV